MESTKLSDNEEFEAMRPEAYAVRYRGMRCPFCRGQDLEYDSIQVGTTTAEQPVFCQDCESAWYDIYELKGYEYDANEVKFEKAVELYRSRQAKGTTKDAGKAAE
jgi:hypothetical protein